MDIAVLIRIILTVLTITLTANCPVAGQQPPQVFRIGTGGTAGVYYPIGKLIATGLTGKQDQDNDSSVQHGIDGYIAVAQSSAGSVENVKTIIAGETQAGLVQADVASMAYNRAGMFKGRDTFTKLRAVASLYPEKFHIVVRNDAGVRNMNDLKGKRISLDESGSGTLSVMRILLSAYGLSEKQLNAVYLKPAFVREKMTSGELQGFVMMAGTPLKTILGLSDIGLNMIPIPKEVAGRISSQYPYLVPGFIKPDVYPGIGMTPTLQVYALFAVSADLHPDLVYKVTQVLWRPRTRDLLKKGHPKGGSIEPGTALTGLSIPLHDGAAKFYKEKGWVEK
jgi:TRAP transporter TAXI family solute receptor